MNNNEVFPVGTELLTRYLKHGVRQLERLAEKGLMEEALEDMTPGQEPRLVFGERTNERVIFSFVYAPAELWVFVEIFEKGGAKRAYVRVNPTTENNVINHDIFVTAANKGDAFNFFAKDGHGLRVKITEDKSVEIEPLANAMLGVEVPEDFLLILGAEELVSTMGA